MINWTSILETLGHVAEFVAALLTLAAVLLGRHRNPGNR
jgi:hypothetical protein